MAADKELDDILASALDEFDDPDAPPKLSIAAASAKGSAKAAERERRERALRQQKALKEASEKASKTDNVAAEQRKEETVKRLTKLVGGITDPEFSQALEDTLTSLGKPGGYNGDPSDVFKGPQTDPKVSEPTVDANIAKTLQMLSEAGKSGIDGMEPAAAEALGEDMMKKIMQDFERMGEKEDFQNVVDGMMKQLLAKEIMYEPIKAICEKYPEWLAENEPFLERAEYERFGRQYQYIQRICACYETQPDNFERLMELMQDMQECGQPPAEIVKELAPGLQFGSDGMPIMPNMGDGMPNFPSVDMPNVPGMNPQCSIQ
eukprot:g2432.t1